MGDVFGGGNSGDGGAAAIAESNRKIAEMNIAAENARAAEAQRIADQQKAEQAAKAAKELADTKAANEKAAADAARVAAANQATGAGAVDTSTIPSGKALAAQSQATGAGLPGFDALTGTGTAVKAAEANQNQPGFQNQSNSLLSLSGLNVGGRKYT